MVDDITLDDPGNILFLVFIIGSIGICGGIFGCNEKLTPYFDRGHSRLQYGIQVASCITVGFSVAGLSYSVVDHDIHPAYSGLSVFVLCGMLLLQAFLWKDDQIPNSIQAKHSYCLCLVVYFLMIPGLVIMGYAHNQYVLRDSYRVITVNTTSAFVEFNANFDCYNWDQQDIDDKSSSSSSSSSLVSKAKACSGYRAKLHVQWWDDVQCSDYFVSSLQSSSQQQQQQMKKKCSTWLWDEDCTILTNKQSTNQDDFLQNIQRVENCIEERYGGKFATTTIQQQQSSDGGNKVVKKLENFVTAIKINVTSSCDGKCYVEPKDTLRDDDEILDKQKLYGFIIFLVGATCVAAIGTSRACIEYKMATKDRDSGTGNNNNIIEETSDDNDDYDDDDSSYDDSESSLTSSGGDDLDDTENDIEIGRDTTSSSTTTDGDDVVAAAVVVDVGNDLSPSLQRIDGQQQQDREGEDSQSISSSSCSLVNENSSDGESSREEEEEDSEDDGEFA